MVESSSQAMGLSSQAFSPTHGSTRLHSLVYIENMHEPYINQSNFIRAKFTRRTRNWIATRIHNTWFHWVGRGHRGHAYLNVARWTHGWWKRESMRITRGLPTMWLNLNGEYNIERVNRCTRENCNKINAVSCLSLWDRENCQMVVIIRKFRVPT